MTERQLQFRVGLFVIAAMIAGLGLGFQFGNMNWFLVRTYGVQVHFDEAPGVQSGTPVRKNGVTIGSVQEVLFDETQGGVILRLDINERFTLRRDSQARISRSLLGDATIEFSPGRSKELLRADARIVGEPVTDPMQVVARMEQQMGTALESFTATSREWQRVGQTVNSLVSTNRGHLDQVIERAAESLHEFTITMRSANAVLGDPENQEHLRATLAALPEMVEDTRLAIQTIRSAVTKMDENMANLKEATGPLAKHSASIASKLDSSVGSLELLLAELNQFARALSKPNGSLNMLVSDPQLYHNLNQSAAALQIVLRNLDPVVKDMRAFSDKVARHPELIGLGGALRGSSGLK